MVITLKQEGSEALFLAVQLNAPVIIEFLLQNGCEVNAIDDNLNSPLHLAVQLNDPESVKVR